jgi:mono/diheme cytochrome c family protein
VAVSTQPDERPFGPMMDDAQIAAVVNYIRTNLGNDYRDVVSAADVKAIRK